MTSARTWDVSALAGLFLASGTIHLVRPRTFDPLMPEFVPAHRAVIVGSGVLELLCAVGLHVPRWRRTAGWASAVLLVGVWPGNVKMALDAVRSGATLRSVIALARLPLQVPLVRVALRAARA